MGTVAQHVSHLDVTMNMLGCYSWFLRSSADQILEWHVGYVMKLDVQPQVL
jgi:hypothetical protein